LLFTQGLTAKTAWWTPCVRERRLRSPSFTGWTLESKR
jgi:hypothetical protein